MVAGSAMEGGGALEKVRKPEVCVCVGGGILRTVIEKEEENLDFSE